MTDAQRLLFLLEKNSQTLSCAESCTGGLICERIVSVPGCSSVFLGGVISYANTVKTSLLGVSDDIISNFGAVSSQCAIQMARGARCAIGSDIALSTTGIAGPGGGSEKKPVGTVYIAVCTPFFEEVKLLNLSKFKNRDEIRAETATLAIKFLIQILEKQTIS